MSEHDEHLPCAEVEPQGEARASVIWLHGLGADGHDFEGAVPMLGLDPALGLRFVFPHAPERPVTINGGMRMRAWYDILAMELERKVDEQAVLESSAALDSLIEREVARGVPTERIIVAGFSQGGAIAVHCALRHPRALAGLIALSTYRVRFESLAAEAHAANASLPIFQAHGSYDPMVPLAAGEGLRDSLREHGLEVEWSAYPMPHAVLPEELEAIGQWITARLAAAGVEA